MRVTKKAQKEEKCHFLAIGGDLWRKTILTSMFIGNHDLVRFLALVMKGASPFGRPVERVAVHWSLFNSFPLISLKTTNYNIPMNELVSVK